MRRGENAAEAGRALARQRGSEYMREIGRRGGEKGGAALAKGRGKKYMRRLSRLAVQAREPGWNAGGERSEETRERMRQAQRRRRRRERQVEGD